MIYWDFFTFFLKPRRFAYNHLCYLVYKPVKEKDTSEPQYGCQNNSGIKF